MESNCLIFSKDCSSIIVIAAVLRTSVYHPSVWYLNLTSLCVILFHLCLSVWSYTIMFGLKNSVSSARVVNKRKMIFLYPLIRNFISPYFYLFHIIYFPVTYKEVYLAIFHKFQGWWFEENIKHNASNIYSRCFWVAKKKKKNKTQNI